MNGWVHSNGLELCCAPLTHIRTHWDITSWSILERTKICPCSMWGKRALVLCLCYSTTLHIDVCWFFQTSLCFLYSLFWCPFWNMYAWFPSHSHCHIQWGFVFWVKHTCLLQVDREQVSDNWQLFVTILPHNIKKRFILFWLLHFHVT